MSQYHLIAFDMDGTLLNSDKKIAESSIAAIEKASKEGKFVILNTGRGPAELTEFFDILKDVRYYNCVSGALVFDHETNSTIFKKAIPVEVVKELFQIAKEEDVMIHILSQKSIVQKDCLENMEHYNMGIYSTMFHKVSDPVDDMEEAYLANPYPVEKFNLYHASIEARDRTYARLKESGLPVELAFSEHANVEVTAQNVDKSLGLGKLCEHLGFTINEAIAVGDADNDYAAIQAAGLGIAMGNANESIKSIADVIVADNDHDGCVEAIEKYLL